MNRARQKQGGAGGRARVAGQQRRAAKPGAARLPNMHPSMCPPGHFVSVRHVRGGFVEGLSTTCMLCPMGYVRPMGYDPRRCTKCGPKSQSSPDRLKCVAAKAQPPHHSQQHPQQPQQATLAAVASLRTSVPPALPSQPPQQSPQKGQAVDAPAKTSAPPVAVRKPTYRCVSGKCAATVNGAGVALHVCQSACGEIASASATQVQAPNTAVGPNTAHLTTSAPPVAKPDGR